jgi:ribose transport system permease protein
VSAPVAMNRGPAATRRTRLSVRERLVLRGRFVPIWVVFALIVAVSPLLASESVSGRSWNNLLFFASLLGLAALGQHLVVVVGGLDMSVGPQMALAALVFAKLGSAVATESSASGMVVAALLAVAACIAIGVINGLAVTLLRITPLIATLAGGALATGAAYTLQGSGAPNPVPAAFSEAVSARPLFGVIAVVSLVWLASMALVAGALRWTPAGRRFVAVGDSQRAARAAGIRVGRYRVFGFAAASVFYALAGLAVGGLAQQPGVALGDAYLLPSIAAVVVGGTPLGGGVGSVASTAMGALFMSHLDALTLSMQAPTSVQLIVQGAVIAGAMAAYGLRLPARLRPRAGDEMGLAASEAADGPAAEGEHQPVAPQGGIPEPVPDIAGEDRRA